MSNFEWLDALGLDRTNLPQLPRQTPEMLGQLKPNKDAMPELPQPAPAQQKNSGAGNKISSSLEGVDRESNCAAERDIQASWADGFLTCWQLLLQSRLLVHPAQQAGKDCQGCRHITMAKEHHTGSRRTFFWRCELGHPRLEIGVNGERIIIAPPACEDYESPEEKKWR
ncbi:MAG TPA: hypothetical protein VFS89_02175 [Nitrosospira sp.]|nr:hypothetical protein [Nitrosospira sp.]